VELLCELAARLAAADHQHLPGRQRGRISVAVGIDLKDAGRQRPRRRRPVWALKGAGRQHDALGEQHAVSGAYRKPSLIDGIERGHLDALAHG